jgi:ligand-binding SRPBCC domain-containing protein
MKEHILKTQIELPLKLTEVFSFFCDTINLERIAPPGLHFQITTPQSIEIILGTVVDYRLRLYTIQSRWQSEITIWRPPYEFVDEQIQGSYCLWIHRHRFCEKTGPQLFGTQFDTNYLCGH